MPFRSNEKSLEEPIPLLDLYRASSSSCWFFFALVAERPQKEIVPITVYDQPVIAANPIRALDLKPKPTPKPKAKVKARKVFGVSKKAIRSQPELTTPKEPAVNVKAGNTTAIAPDDKILREDDAQSLPIPTADYLVSRMPVLLKELKIPYPPNSKRDGVEGPVVMDLLVDTEGSVRQVELVTGPNEELNGAAVEAAKALKFKPARVEDQPVAVRIRYVYRFVLERT